MMEILFRGKCIGNKEWIEDGEWVDGLPMYTANKSEKGKIDRILTLRDGYYSILLVDPGTVCQYTGLTDKNGRKIFEGDCLGHELNVVEYMNGCFTVSGDRPLSLMAKYNEVIGNIFDKE